ncbi:ATPase [Gordoniibacillus kamchatkensis]|uniref:ATPase n=1 Tax=Gordoniibacillus kamchatkensis TaxID=1590651 RepID=A0ABR5AI66_9BACL|nr:SRPBCC domain-containing protein [Paenibacillus sp. VKM B-2647]KIL40714.1 ATPase [Paenibacillus sp. VKM B-2647]
MSTSSNSPDTGAAPARPVGLTAGAGFQIGVRRTLPVSQEQAWALLTSAEGLPLWIGQLRELPLTPGQTYVTDDGISGEMRVVKPGEQLRLTWRKPEWPGPSTLQIRLIPSHSGRTTISFHQEKLADMAAREQMKLRWEEALAAIAGNL